MNVPVRVHLSPPLFEPADLRGGLAIVIDVLRASTTITQALASGAAAVWPCREVEEARRAAAKLKAGAFLLGGERGGVRIEGFDLGNSPAEYRTQVVGGKTIVFTTTNGTNALKRSGEAARILVGSFLNVGAVVMEAAAFGRPVHLVCAGVHGQVCSEDVLCAGAIARGVERLTGAPLVDDAARLAAGAWDAVAGDPRALVEALRAGHGGRNLASIGLSADVELCGALDTVRVVPFMREGRLHCGPGESLAS